MKIFDKKFESEGFFIREEKDYTVKWKIEKIFMGWKISGYVKGKPGKLLIFQGKTPEKILVNNWQSWGPCKVVDKNFRFQIQDFEYKYFLSIFPERHKNSLISDYFLAYENTVFGFLSSKIAHPYFEINSGKISAYLDFFEIYFENFVPLEPFVILENFPVETLLNRYAELIRNENQMKFKREYKVWCSWYQYYQNLTWEDVQKNLEIAKKYPFDVFQIDDGYEKDIGDWLKSKKGFSEIEEIAKKIREKGLIPGIWIAPFIASESSKLYNDHKDWFVKENDKPKVIGYVWNKNIYALDLTKDQVKNWIRELFKKFKNAGFEYFKLDFLFAGAINGERERNVTPIQAYIEGMETIKEILNDSFILGCGAPLLPSVGYVDAMRIGADTTSKWFDSQDLGEPNIKCDLRNVITRSFMNKKLWINDPDCLILRSKKSELSENQKKLFAYTVALLDNMICQSDDLELVDEKDKEILFEALKLKGSKYQLKGILNEDMRYEITAYNEDHGKINLKFDLNEPNDFVLTKEYEHIEFSKLNKKTIKREDGRSFHFYFEENEGDNE